jgi:peptide-methionine (R)-S-oxide reductase
LSPLADIALLLLLVAPRAAPSSTSATTGGSCRSRGADVGHILLAVSGFVLLCWIALRMSMSAFDLRAARPGATPALTAGLAEDERRVLLEHGTERAFCGVFLDNKKDGTYCCRFCGLPLFRSSAKFDSGTGWPSFFAPYDDAHVRTIRDTSYGMIRTEIVCARCGSHLGHVFPDGRRRPASALPQLGLAVLHRARASAGGLSGARRERLGGLTRPATTSMVRAPAGAPGAGLTRARHAIHGMPQMRSLSPAAPHHGQHHAVT